MTRARRGLKHLKKVWAGILCLCLVCMWGNSATAEEIQNLAYDVYAGGFNVVRADVIIERQEDGHYAISLQSRTQGFLGTLAPWEGIFESEGVKTPAQDYRPVRHRSATMWSDELEENIYSYNLDGTFESFVKTEGDKVETSQPDHELVDQTTDVLTATMNVLSHYQQTGECAGRAEVFDGKRRFAQIFKPEGQENLEATRYNVFEGQSGMCTVEVEPIAGAWHKKPRGWMSIQEQGRERGMMPTLWVAQLHEDDFPVPVKIRVKTAYGTLFMHLVQYESDGRVLLAEK